MKKVVIIIVVIAVVFLIGRLFFSKPPATEFSIPNQATENETEVKPGYIAPSQQKAYIELQKRWEENRKKAATSQ